jgi:hypothetical protein
MSRLTRFHVKISKSLSIQNIPPKVNKTVPVIRKLRTKWVDSGVLLWTHPRAQVFIVFCMVYMSHMCMCVGGRGVGAPPSFIFHLLKVHSWGAWTLLNLLFSFMWFVGVGIGGRLPFLVETWTLDLLPHWMHISFDFHMLSMG